ncbi:MAG: hypothetical protein GXO69_08865 [Acidobacteria bacterium]|nr:hypothetical protein [Acidobacteriota bacterium]
MKKHIMLIVVIALFSATACGPFKVSKMQMIGVQNHTLVLYFSKKIKHSFSLSIDGTEVPVAAPARGRLLQIHNLKPGMHHIRIVSNWYIFEQPIRNFTFDPEKNQTALVFAVLKYSETTRPIQEQRPGIFKRTLNMLMFWKGKETSAETKIDTSKIYGEFTR